MATENKLSRNAYLSRNVGSYPETTEFFGLQYEKIDDLRYGTNPHQTACSYRPIGRPGPIADMKVLKNGKSGLSQTNLEDISYALNIVKFFDRPACAVMKHVNPSGVAAALEGDTIAQVYLKARDSDPRAAFGSTIAFNCPIDADTAKEIMSTFNECVVAPEVTPEALAIFMDETSKLNRHIRILQCGDISKMPKYVGEDVTGYQTFKVLADGTIVVADPLLTNMKCLADMKVAEATRKDGEVVRSTVVATEQQKIDLLTAWYINLNVRSNGVVIVKNGGTLAVGTGEQDRVGAVEQAIVKCNEKYAGTEKIQDSVMASDGFFPFPDAVEVAAAAGVTAIIAPSGSLKDADVIARANELGVALYHASERIFSHH